MAGAVFFLVIVAVLLVAFASVTPFILIPVVAIGLGLTLIHLISIPVTNTSVNPARSLGVAWFAGADALAQVWLFILAPLIGAAIAGATFVFITGVDRSDVDVVGDSDS